MAEGTCVRCERALAGDDHIGRLVGVCPRCLRQVLSPRDHSVSEYLDTIRIPAALVSENLQVLFANTDFRTLRPDADPETLRVGEMLSCMYTATLGRCGETVTCLLCAMKQSINHTSSTGNGVRARPMSYPHRKDVRKVYLISTEKVGDAVLVVLEGPQAG